MLEDGTVFRNLSDYSVSEDATPISITDQTGGANESSISVSGDRVDGKMLHRMKATLSDGSSGTTTGTLSSPSGSTSPQDGSSLSLPLTSALNALTATRVALPYAGTLAGYFDYVLGLVGIAEPVIDGSFAEVDVVFAGWNGDVRTNLWEVCAAHGAEVTLIANQTTVRPVRQRVITNRRDASEAWSLSDDNIAQSVEGYWYDSVNHTVPNLVYPPGGWNSDVQILTVPAGQVQEYDLDLTNFDDNGEGAGFSVHTFTQPACVDSVGPADDSASVYTVSGDDGLPVPSAEWAALGGGLEVTLNPDGQTLHVKITGMQSIADAGGQMIQNYSIAMSSGESDNYSSLRILGTGVSYYKHKVTALSGLSADMAPTQVGATIDSPFITDPAALWSILTWPLSEAQGPTQTITVQSRAVNRAGDTGSFAQPTINDFDTHYAGDTINQIDADNSGLTLDGVETKGQGWVAGRFENQAFGNVAGARILSDGAWYRVTTATITPTSTTYSALEDTTINDFDEFYAGMTINQIDAANGDRTLNQQAIRPLVKEAA